MHGLADRYGRFFILIRKIAFSIDRQSVLYQLVLRVRIGRGIEDAQRFVAAHCHGKTTVPGFSVVVYNLR